MPCKKCRGLLPKEAGSSATPSCSCPTNGQKIANTDSDVEFRPQHTSLQSVTIGRSLNTPSSLPHVSLSEAKPIARCSYHEWYNRNQGQGALKYDPVTCSKIHDFAACKKLWKLRHGDSVNLTFTMKIEPKCKLFKRKILVVPSIGCPKLLRDKDFVGKLLWAQVAQGRPTLLLVHQCEVEDYNRHIGKILKEFGVGLVAWDCGEVVGFGASRLAAQQCVSLFNGKRLETVLCDVNVTYDKKFDQNLVNGYDTDGEKGYIKKTIKGPGIYYAAGRGSGIPMYNYKDGELAKIKGANQGGLGRPIEQLVVVGDEMLYDPCFVTSSEDADLTHALFEDTGCEKSIKFKRTKSTIKKVNIGASSLTTAYTNKR